MSRPVGAPGGRTTSDPGSPVGVPGARDASAGAPMVGVTGRGRPRRWAALLACVALAAAAGCTVEVVDEDASGGTSADAGRTDGDDTHAEVSGDGTTHAEAEVASAEPSVRTTPDQGGGAAAGSSGLPPVLDRAGLQELVTQQGMCSGDLQVALAGEAVEVVGDCGTLTVAGAATSVLAGHVDHLVVSGGGATVVVASVDRVTIQAAGVRVAWEDGTPEVDNDAADASYGPVGVVRLDASHS